MSADEKVDDARVVDNPITDMFQLSEDLYTLIPELRRMLLYSYFYLVATLFVIFVFIMLAFATNNIFVVILLIMMFLIGAISFNLMRKLSRFIDYFSVKHKAINAVYETHDVAIPAGEDPVARLVTHIASRDLRLKGILRQMGLKRNYPVKKGRSKYTFDAVALARPSLTYRLFSYGDPGYALFIKVMDAYPTMMRVVEFEGMVSECARSMGIAPTRAVILVVRPENELDDNVYDHILSTPLTFRAGLLLSRRCTCTVQIVTEGEDGRYDFIPFIPFAE